MGAGSSPVRSTKFGASGRTYTGPHFADAGSTPVRSTKYVEFGLATAIDIAVVWKDVQNAIRLDASLQVMLLLGGRIELEIVIYLLGAEGLTVLS
jgi:hypothetical protein